MKSEMFPTSQDEAKMTNNYLRAEETRNGMDRGAASQLATLALHFAADPPTSETDSWLATDIR